MDYSISTREFQVDNRFPLSFYFRIATNMINQAKVYRVEKNITDLYLTLNRYCSLVSETIPRHRNYSAYSGKEKLHHKKILQQILKELMGLKPLVQKKVDGFSRQHMQDKYSGNSGSLENRMLSQNLKADHLSKSGSVRSILSLDNTSLGSVIMVDTDTTSPSGSPCSTTFATAGDCNINVHVVTQSSPSPILSCVQGVPPEENDFTRFSHIPFANPRDRNLKSSQDDISGSKAIQDVHISVRLMEDFLELARVNTEKDVETCGILGAFLKNRTFYVTTLIIPKQESTSNSCQALNEEEIYTIQDEQSLFPLGWIHTHPSQTCFMSSIDLHTHYSYQVMLPEAVAIVIAPTDTSRSFGIFRLSDPEGITILRECQERGFHLHQEPADGTPIFEDCSHVYVNPNLRLEIIDLR